LRGFDDSGPQEDGPETGEPGTEKVDRSRTTLRNLLTMFIVFIVLQIAPLTSVSIGKRSGSQATNRDGCQPPLCFTIAHCHSLALQ
jgi:hypothetical protein